MIWIYIFISFSLSYFISTLEYAKNNFPKNKGFLFTTNIFFSLLGIVHGFIASGILYTLCYRGVVDINMPFEVLFYSIGIGLGIKGFTNISFYERESTEGKKKVDYGPKEVVKFLEKQLEPHIKEKHDIAIKGYIEKKYQIVNNYSKEHLIDSLLRYLPLEDKKNKKYLEEGFLLLVPEWGDFEIQEYYISEFGKSRYDKAIKSLQTQN